MLTEDQLKVKINELICYASDNLSLEQEDEYYVLNTLLDFFGLNAPAPAIEKYGDFQTEIIDPIVQHAIDTGRIIFADDVNYLGLVEGGAYPPHKHRTIVNNMRAFVAKISDPALFDSKIYDVGDGVAVCRKL